MSKPGGLESSASMLLRGVVIGRKWSPAARLELVADLLAPRDENGVPRPENAIIDAETARRMLEAKL